MTAASEIFGARERPYDFRWGTLEAVKDAFGINPPTLKAAWRRGWIRARQGNWDGDQKRTQTVYCFEDIHGYMERVMHQVTEDYATNWWTDDEITRLAEVTPDGPYTQWRLNSSRGDAAAAPAATRQKQAARVVTTRQDGFTRLPRSYN